MPAVSSYTFRQFRYCNAFVGYPSITAFSQNEVFVTDWYGNLKKVKLDYKVVPIEKSAFVGKNFPGGMPVACTLRSPIAFGPDLARCGVATGGMYAAVWEPESGLVVELESDTHPVNAVGWMPFNDWFLVGVGMYSLSGNDPRAELQYWLLPPTGPTLDYKIALPGCCIDAIAWNRLEHEVLVYSGLSSQGRGFLTALDARSGLPRAVFDYPFAFVRKIIPTESGRVLLVGGHDIHCVSRESGKVEWKCTVAGKGIDAGWSRREILCSDGQLLCSRSGTILERLTPLEGCCSVTALPEGGYAGVSPTGTIGVWECD